MGSEGRDCKRDIHGADVDQRRECPRVNKCKLIVIEIEGEQLRQANENAALQSRQKVVVERSATLLAMRRQPMMGAMNKQSSQGREVGERARLDQRDGIHGQVPDARGASDRMATAATPNKYVVRATPS